MCSRCTAGAELCEVSNIVSLTYSNNGVCLCNFTTEYGIIYNRFNKLALTENTKFENTPML